MYDSSSDSDDELFPIAESLFRSNLNVFLYEDPVVVSGVLRAVVEDDCDKIERLIKSGYSININDNNGNTPLHVAVIRNNLQILDCLLAHDEILVNTRNFLGETALFHAAKNGRYEAVNRLIQSGANVNLSNFEDVNPLHVSVTCPAISQLLIKNGSRLDAVDYSGDAPLHDAIAEGCLETICLMLYYNADANAVGGNGLSPFMKAIIGGSIEIQAALYEYVSEFNFSTNDDLTTLDLALIHNSPHKIGILRSGAKVRRKTLIFCLHESDFDAFRLIWDRLEYDKKDPVMIDDLISHLSQCELKEYLEFMLESKNVDLFINFLIPNFYYEFISKFAEAKLPSDLLTKITCRLLEKSYRLQFRDIYEIYVHYGYCELFKILLYMEYYGTAYPYIITPRLIFDIHSDIKNVSSKLVNVYKPSVNTEKFRRDLTACLEYFSDQTLTNIYSPELCGSVPLLLELARNKTREYILRTFNVTSTCQYYTLINSLDLADVHKRILKFEKTLYNKVVIKDISECKGLVSDDF